MLQLAISNQPENDMKKPSQPAVEIGSTLYICNVQNKTPEGEWLTHHTVTKRTEAGIAEYIALENRDLGGGLIAWGRNTRRLMVRKVTIDAVEFRNLR